MDPPASSLVERRVLEAREVDIGREIEYTMRCAAAGETHIVGLRPLVLVCERYALAWEETFQVSEGCFWTHDGRTTAHHAFPAAEIQRAVAAARRR